MRGKILLITFLGCALIISCKKGSQSPSIENSDSLVSELARADLTKLEVRGSFWKKAKTKVIPLVAQPMIAPRPKITMTESIQVQSAHNEEWIAFLLQWHDTEKSEGGKPGTFSDAVAIQFPIKEKEIPPPIFMGMRDDPVHILHWRAQYQKDKEEGFQTMQDLYPNMSIDMYPLEFADEYVHDKVLLQISETQREIFIPGKAAGNPQSFRKINGIDEIFAEGFGSSSVIENSRALAKGEWSAEQWTVMIVRPLSLEGGSMLASGKKGNTAFAVWQGGKGEVGSRKSVTMSWTPLVIK